MTGERNSNIKIVFLLLITLLLFTVSCNLNDRISYNEEIPQAGWSKYNRPRFKVEMNDTVSAFDILFSIRNSYNYPYRNLFLFVSTSSPSGQYLVDTIEYQLANERGDWYGKGLGDIHNLAVPFKTNVKFTQRGEYTFQIEHGMRTDNLEGIIDVGIIIRKRDE